MASRKKKPVARNKRAAPKPPKELTAKQKRFVAAFDGNAADAARKAGYSGTNTALSVTGTRLLANAKIRKLINAREENRPATKKAIATREQRQEFWTATMVDPTLDYKHRLKAAELLGRSQTDFVDRRELSVDLGEKMMGLFVDTESDD